MRPFEISELYVIIDHPGLWRAKGEAGRMIVFYNLLDESKVITVPRTKIKGNIDNYEVYTDKGRIKLEVIISQIMEIVSVEKIVLPEDFKKLPDSEKKNWMTKLVPGYDPNAFKSYHLDQILKWYKDIIKALDILNENVEDPYENMEISEVTEDKLDIENIKDKLEKSMPEVHRQIKVYEDKLKSGTLTTPPDNNPLFDTPGNEKI